MADDFSLKIRRFDAQDPRLGRHVVHDSRSLRYRFRATRAPRKLASVRHNIQIPVMDQGNLGSCTGHAGTNVLASGSFWTAAQAPLIAAGDPHSYAVGLYSDATRLDPWPGAYEPDDTGSDGLSIAKALQGRGLISGYQHAMSLQDALAALAERVVMVGTNWLGAMFEPTPDGQLTVSGSVEGGHEYALDELDVARKRVWMRNSWGSGWGIEGRAWMSWDDLGQLLDADGDCTVLIPLAEPAPQPEPAPEPKPDTEKDLAQALRRFLPSHAAPAYLKKPGTVWLKGR